MKKPIIIAMALASLALAVKAGLHVRAAGLLVLSYDFLPAGHFPRVSDISAWGLHQVSQATALGFSLAAPFVVASVIYNVALGVINRAMPQMPVALVGAPVLTAGALMLMALTVPLMLGIWLTSLDAFLANPMGTAP